jgi:hypothetical protein
VNALEGAISKILNLASGKFALLENSRESSLVPWRPILEKNIGKEVSGIMREGRPLMGHRQKERV